MNFELNVSEQTQRQLLVIVDKDTYEKDYLKAQKNYIKQIEIPGFRKGKAPLPVILRQYEEQIKSFYLDQYADTYFRYGMLESKAKAITQPSFVDCIFHESGEVTFVFEFESFPEGFQYDYKGITVKYKELEYTEEMLEKTISDLLLENLEEVPLEENQGIKPDDIITLLNLTTNEELKNIVLEKNELEKYGFIEKDLLGLKIKDIFIAETIKYQVIDAFHRVIPELNDETAKVFGHDNVALMREHLKDTLIKDINRKNDMDFITSVIEGFAAHNKENIKIPQALILDAGRRLLAQYLAGKTDDLDKIPEDFIFNLGEREVPFIIWDLIYEKIAKDNDITIKQEEIDLEIEKFAIHYSTTASDLITKNNSLVNRIQDDLLSKKVIEYIKQFCVIVEPDETIYDVDDNDIEDADFEIEDQ